MTEIKIKQLNMLCHRCLLNIVKTLEQIRCILEFDIRLEEQSIYIEFSEDVFEEERIKQIINAAITTGKIPFDLIGDYSKE